LCHQFKGSVLQIVAAKLQFLDDRPMTTFDKREQAFENKFALDEELKFKSVARCKRLLGAWAAEKLGLTGEDAAVYARDIVLIDLDEPGAGHVIQKIAQDLAGHGVSEAVVVQKRDEFLYLAIEQIEAGK
jgi:hypothetical protein